MSINRKMLSYALQERKEQRNNTGSGAPKQTWTDGDDVDVAVYKISEVRVSSSERYKECTHVGYTYSKEIKSYENRLVGHGHTYEIMSFDGEPRLGVALLKEVTNV